MKNLVVTTSWDDGHILDKIVTDLLNRHGLKGTFYIPENYGLRSLTDKEVKIIAKEQEIGAHTLTHPDLTQVSSNKAREEIFGSKKYLEELLAKEVKMFCYPGGWYNSEIKNIVEEAGFLGARTTEEWSFEAHFDCFEMPASLHIYPFPFRPLSSVKQYKNPKNFLEPLLRNCRPIIKHRFGPRSFFSWPALARASFLHAKEHGAVFHLFGHSWEIEKYGLWNDLEEFFKYISGRKDCLYVTNGELIESGSKSD